MKIIIEIMPGTRRGNMHFF